MGRIVAQILIAAAATAAALFAQQQSQTQQQEPEFRIRTDVRLVRLLATVKDPSGAIVGDLEKKDFRVTDNGVEQEVAVFERTTSQPLSVSLLVDTSASTATHLKQEIESVQRFLKALFKDGNTADRASIYSFNYQVTLERGFTREIPRLESSLRGLKSEGGTALYDGIQFASRNLERRDGRRVIIVISDGGDTVSSVKFADAKEAAQRADAVIYPILIVPITNEAGRNVGGEHALQTLAQETGGKVFMPVVGVQLDNAFNSILRDLRNQYLLGYYPRNLPPTRNRFHRVTIETSRPGLRISARSGYYGDATQ